MGGCRGEMLLLRLRGNRSGFEGRGGEARLRLLVAQVG